MSHPSFAPIRCDIFCVVIDNFGDAGVCLRLARQLANEHGWHVRLLVDHLPTLARLCPEINLGYAQQRVHGVLVQHGFQRACASHGPPVAEVVIEAFACTLPPAYIAAMAQRTRAPIWFNLEYLSAEDWVPDYHLRPSPHPHYSLTKIFFFPGFSPGTGGLLKERSLDAARQAFQTSEPARTAWWRRTIGDAPPANNVTLISLFTYENPAINALLEQWRDQSEDIALLVPEGNISKALARFFGLPSFAAGARAQRGSLNAYSLAFTAQADFDVLLWRCHLNFVRGEDSFVRAQWAQRPLVWHIYPQAGAAHQPKLNAALKHYTAALPLAARRATERFWHAWNHPTGQAQIAPDWQDFWGHRTWLETHATRWPDTLSTLGDLAGNLVKFTKTQIK